MSDEMATGRTSQTAPDKPLGDEYRNILSSVRLELVKDMDPEDILLKMAAKHVFTQGEEEKIRAKQTRGDQCVLFLDILPRKGAKAYDIFKEALGKVYPHLANVILEAENKELRSEETVEPANRARPAPDSARLADFKKKPVTLEIISKLKDDAGTCWKDLGITLEIKPEARVLNLERDIGTSSERARSVLEMWRDQKGRAATVGLLADALMKIGQKRISETLLALCQAEQ